MQALATPKPEVSTMLLWYGSTKLLARRVAQTLKNNSFTLYKRGARRLMSSSEMANIMLEQPNSAMLAGMAQVLIAGSQGQRYWKPKP